MCSLVRMAVHSPSLSLVSLTSGVMYGLDVGSNSAPGSGVSVVIMVAASTMFSTDVFRCLAMLGSFF